MGMDFSSTHLPSGRPALLIKVSGPVGQEDVDRLTQHIGKDGQYHRLPMLSLIASDADYSMEARRGFANMGGDTGVQAPVAVVMNSAPLRMIINFIVKAGNLRSGKPTNLKFFAAEDEARKWLDAECDKAQPS